MSVREREGTNGRSIDLPNYAANLTRDRKSCMTSDTMPSLLVTAMYILYYNNPTGSHFERLFFAQNT